MADDLILCQRTLAALLLLLIITRILGRRTLSELTFYDFIIGLVLGEVGAAIITDQISLRSGFIALLVATLWVLALTQLVLKSLPARKLLEAEPLLVICQGSILESNLKKRYYNVNDLLELLREQGIFDPSQVEAALLEADGHLSVLQKQPSMSVPAKAPESSLPPQPPLSPWAGKELIIDGVLLEDNLALYSLTREQLNSQLQALGITAIEQVALAIITPEGKFYTDVKNDAPVIPLNKKSH